MALVMVATCQTAVFAKEPASADNGDAAVLTQDELAELDALSEEELLLEEELAEDQTESEVDLDVTDEEQGAATDEMGPEAAESEITEPEEIYVTEPEEVDATETEETTTEEVLLTDPAEETDLMETEEGLDLDALDAQLGASNTDWSLPKSGKYSMILRSNGSVLNLHLAAGERVGGYDSVQGGCVNDGIGYFSLANRNKPKYAKIMKVKMSTGKVLKVSKALKIYHANDLTYNTKTDKIIVAHAEGDRKHLSIINPTTLKKESTKKIRVNRSCGMTSKERRRYIGFGAIAYNEKHDEYVVRLNNLSNLLVLNAKFKPVRYVKLSKKVKQTYQGLESINDYFLVCASPKKAGQYNVVAVYNYKGKYLKKIKIRRDLELESVMHDGGTTYITMYEEGGVAGKVGPLRNGFVMKLGTADGRYIFPTYPAYNAKRSIRNATINEWLKNYSAKSIKKYSTGKNIYYPKKIKFTWSIDEGVKASYKLKISESSKMTNCREISTDCRCAVIGNFKVNTKYYWQVVGKTDTKTVKSKIHTFTTKKGPRTLKVTGVGNLRDIGGWSTTSGGVVRQGKVYRSAQFDNIESRGKRYMIKTLGVKTDLDLRQEGSGNAGKGSPLGSDVNYIHIGKDGGVFNDEADTAAGRKMIAKEMRVFADRDNYPIVVHCRIGRDRTGLVCYLLEALAGVSPKNCIKDYQISFLSKDGCKFMKTIDKDYCYINMVEKMLRSYGKSGDSLQTCTEKYLRKCGLKQKEIDTIKKILVKE